MSEKIIVVSMAKNEADIIESFVRYHMTFVDGMIILDHNSDDNTGKILDKLKEEYPSLIIDKLDAIEHVQYEVMTNLVKIAANELQADWILPLDIDEFLIPKVVDDDCRSLFKKITHNVISLDWLDYELVEPEQNREKFLLNRNCNRSKKLNSLSKVLLNGNFVRENKIRLAQGNHGVLIQLDNGTEQIAHTFRTPDFTLAHFPFRTQDQYISKNVIGWLTNILRYSATTIVASHWQESFEKICNNDVMMPTIPDSQYVGNLYDKDIELKYTGYTPINVLPRVLKLAEKVFDDYTRKIILDKLSTVIVIMPLGQDLDAVVETIGSLLNQTMQNWRLIIIAPDDIDEEIKKSLVECDKRISIVGKSDDIAHEGYVKLISPGKKLSPKCLEMEAVALYSHKEFHFNLTYSNGINSTGADIVAKYFYAQEGIDIWNKIKDTPYNLTGGISGMMLREIPQNLDISKMIQNYQWKEKEILSVLLPDNVVLVFPMRLIS